MKTIDENTFLMDDWCQTGSNYAEFCEALNELQNRTRHIQVQPSCITVYTYSHFDETEHKDVLFAIDPVDALHKTPGTEKTARKADFSTVPERAALLEETKKGSGIMFQYHEPASAGSRLRFAFVSQKFISRDLPMFDIGGTFALDACYGRNLIIARQFAKRKNDVMLCARKTQHTCKVFGVRSQRYKVLPLTIICSIADKIINEGTMGDVKCKDWYIDHFRVQLMLEFPDVADELKATYDLTCEDIIPGVIIETSDTGDCALRARGYWRVKNARSNAGTVEQKHIGDNCIVDAVANRIDTEIFPDYRCLPEALSKLLRYSINDPRWDIKHSAGRKEKIAAIMRIYGKAFKQLDLEKAIGKKLSANLLSEIERELDPKIDYTAYDLCINLLTLPNRCDGISKAAFDKLTDAISRAPYIDYSMVSAPSPVILLA